MKKPAPAEILIPISALFCVLLFASACTATPASLTNQPSALLPAGPAAGHIAALWWLMLGLGAAIFVLVIGLLAAAYLRRRRATGATLPESGLAREIPERTGSRRSFEGLQIGKNGL